MSEKNIGNRIASDYFEETSGAYESLSSSINTEIAALSSQLTEAQEVIKLNEEYGLEGPRDNKVTWEEYAEKKGLLRPVERGYRIVLCCDNVPISQLIGFQHIKK